MKFFVLLAVVVCGISCNRVDEEYKCKTSNCRQYYSDGNYCRNYCE